MTTAQIKSFLQPEEDTSEIINDDDAIDENVFLEQTTSEIQTNDISSDDQSNEPSPEIRKKNFQKKKI